jgi:hypothetical protein
MWSILNWCCMDLDFQFSKFQASTSLEEPLPEPTPGRRQEHKVGKIHFVEHRSGFHLYHSFHRLWIFFLCMLQVRWLCFFLYSFVMIKVPSYCVSQECCYLLLQATHFLNRIFFYLILVVWWVFTGVNNMGILQQEWKSESPCANNQENHECWSHVCCLEVCAMWVASCHCRLPCLGKDEI